MFVSGGELLSFACHIESFALKVAGCVWNGGCVVGYAVGQRVGRAQQHRAVAPEFQPVHKNVVRGCAREVGCATEGRPTGWRGQSDRGGRRDVAILIHRERRTRDGHRAGASTGTGVDGDCVADRSAAGAVKAGRDRDPSGAVARRPRTGPSCGHAYEDRAAAGGRGSAGRRNRIQARRRCACRGGIAGGAPRIVGTNAVIPRWFCIVSCFPDLLQASPA